MTGEGSVTEGGQWSVPEEGQGNRMTENIKVYTQSSIRIGSCVGNIYLDPFQMKEAPHDAAYILITHDHYDHFSPEDIAKVGRSDTILIVPEKMEMKAHKAAGSVGRICTVKPGTYHALDGLELETVHAFNHVNPFQPKSAEWVGYILRQRLLTASGRLWRSLPIMEVLWGKKEDAEVFRKNVKEPVRVEVML